jgi:hypothetical protein
LIFVTYVFHVRLAHFVSFLARARIFKRLWSPGLHSKECIPPAYVACWRAGMITLFLVGSLAPIDCLKIRAQARQE